MNIDRHKHWYFGGSRTRALYCFHLEMWIMQGFDHFVTADNQCVIIGFILISFAAISLIAFLTYRVVFCFSILCSCVRVGLFFATVSSDFSVVRLSSQSSKNQKSNLHYTRRYTLKRVTSCGVHLRDLAPGLHSSEEASQRWRVVGDTVPI